MTPTPDRSLYSISIGVLAAHAAAMVVSFFFAPTHPMSFPPPPKLLVKTISLQPSAPAVQAKEEPIIAEAEVVPHPPTPAPQPEPIPEPKPAPAPEPPPKTPEPPPKPVEPAPKPKPKPKKSPKKVEQPKPKPPMPKPKTDLKPPITAKKTPAPKKTETPVAQKKADKKPAETKPTPITEKKTAPPPKPSAEEIAAKEKQQALIAQVKENIAKIGKSRDKGSVIAAAGLPEGPAITHLENLHIDALPDNSGATFNQQESSYRDELASRLKLLLSLPEYGEVKIRLTLDRSGKVKKVEVVKAENSANRKYVEKTIPTLKFPPFGNYFGDSESYTFLISLRNE